MAPAAPPEHTHTGEQPLQAFPGEHPPQHAARDWLESTNDAINRMGLTPVLSNELPTRVRSLRNFPDELTTVPDKVAASLDKDPAKLYQLKAAAAERLLQNERSRERSVGRGADADMRRAGVSV